MWCYVFHSFTLAFFLFFLSLSWGDKSDNEKKSANRKKKPHNIEINYIIEEKKTKLEIYELGFDHLLRFESFFAWNYVLMNGV